MYSIGLAINIWPFRIYKKVSIHTKMNGIYTIGNNENADVQISIHKSDAADWFILKQQEFVLKPGESKEISYSILVKDFKKQGEFKSGIIVSQKVIKKTNQMGAAGFQTRMNLPVYIVIGDSAKIDYEIVEIKWNGSLHKKDESFEGYISCSAQVRNTGNVHIMCEKRLSITLLQKKQNTLIGEFNPNKPELIFPEEKKEINIDYKVKLEPGLYEARIFLYFGFDKDLEIDNEESLKKEKCYNKLIHFNLDTDGQFTLVQ